VMNQPDMAAYLLHNARVDQFLFIGSILGVLLAGVFWMLPNPWRIHTAPRFRLWPLLALALLIRLPLMMQSPWYDETFSWSVVNVPWDHFFIAVSGDVHPPLYYGIMKVFADVFGYNIIALRLPALLFGLMLIPATYSLGYFYDDRRSAAMTAVLVAFLPATVYYSTEARYPIFMALMAVYTFLCIKDNRRWLFALFAALLSLSHATGAVYLAVFGLLALWRWRRRAVLPVLASGLPILSWIPFMLTQADLVTDGFWLVPSILPYRHLVEMTLSLNFSHVFIALAGVAVLVAVVVLAVYRFRLMIDPAWLAVAAGVPALLFIVSHTVVPVYLARTLIMPSLLIVVAVAWWIVHKQRRWLVAAFSVFIFIALAGLLTEQRAKHAETFKLCDPDQQVVATNTYTGIMASYYAPGSLTWTHGDSIAQQLTDASRAALLDTVELADLSGDVCFIGQVSVFNEADEVELIQFLSSIIGTQSIRDDDIHNLSHWIAIDVSFP